MAGGGEEPLRLAHAVDVELGAVAELVDRQRPVVLKTSSRACLQSCDSWPGAATRVCCGDPFVAGAVGLLECHPTCVTPLRSPPSDAEETRLHQHCVEPVGSPGRAG
jgi:hypothetical protein